MRIKLIIILSFLSTLFSGCLVKETINLESTEFDNLRGKNLFCEDYYSYVTYSFFDHKRYQTNYYFLKNFEIGQRKGVYGVLDDVRYFYLSADKKLIIFNQSDESKKEKNWERKIYRTPRLDYYLDRENLNIVFSPNNYSEIKHKCEIFDGTSEELREITLNKYLKHFEDEKNQRIYEEIKKIDNQRKKNKI